VLKQRHQLFVVLMLLADAAVAACACYVAWIVRLLAADDPWPSRWQEYLREPLILLVVPVVLIAMWASRLYQPRRDRSIFPELAEIFRASVLSLGGLVVVLWAAGNQSFHINASTVAQPGAWLETTRLQIAVLAMALPVLLGTYRTVFRLSLRYIRSRGRNLRHVLVIGTGRLGQIVCRTLERNSWTGIHVDSFLSHHDITQRTECLHKPVRGGVSDLRRVMETLQPDAVYLAIPTARSAVIPSILKQLENFAVDVRIVPDVYPRHLPQSMTVAELDGMPILSVRESPLYGLGGASKRVLDICGALFGLVVLSPVLLAIACLVKLSSPGPAIFKQRRVGLNGENFKIYKFRTMFEVRDETPLSDGVEASTPGWTPRNSPRVTPIGGILRRTSLDELPQLLNVLKGQMSLVGPRPERPELIARFREDWRGYMLRQHVKAGMTGWAQVNGLRGDTSLRKRIQYDLFYIRHWSLWFDLRILWMTIYRGWLHPNAH
jgi:hypothetical protein